MNKTVFNNVVIFGTYFGVMQSLNAFPKEKIVAIIAPANRPEQLSQIKELAERNNIKFLEQVPKKSSGFSLFFSELASLKPDLIWSNSHSMLIPDQILDLVNFNAINVHWSLLPLNQGPNPIQWSLIHGEKETGVTFHLMNSKIDTGGIIFQESIEIDSKDTWVSLFNKLEKLSLEMHINYVQTILAGNFKATSQDQEKATQNKRLTKDSPQINFTKMSDLNIYDLIRAQVDPLSGAFILKKDGTKIHFKQKIPLSEIAELRKLYGK